MTEREGERHGGGGARTRERSREREREVGEGGREGREENKLTNQMNARESE